MEGKFIRTRNKRNSTIYLHCWLHMWCCRFSLHRLSFFLQYDKISKQFVAKSKSLTLKMVKKIFFLFLATNNYLNTFLFCSEFFCLPFHYQYPLHCQHYMYMMCCCQVSSEGGKADHDIMKSL